MGLGGIGDMLEWNAAACAGSSTWDLARTALPRQRRLSCIGAQGPLRVPPAHAHVLFTAVHILSTATPPRERGNQRVGGITRLAGIGGRGFGFFWFVSKRGETTSPSYRRIFYITSFLFVGLVLPSFFMFLGVFGKHGWDGEGGEGRRYRTYGGRWRVGEGIRG